MVALVAVVSFAACSKSSDSGTPTVSGVPPTSVATVPPSAMPTSPGTSSSDLSGTWTGQWQRVGIAGQGPMTLTLQESGSTLSGSVEFKGSLCVTPAKQLTGTVLSDLVHFGVDEGGTVATFTGKLTGSTLAGVASVTCKGLTGGARWTVSRS